MVNFEHVIAGWAEYASDYRTVLTTDFERC